MRDINRCAFGHKVKSWLIKFTDLLRFYINWEVKLYFSLNNKH